jgi:DNA modification methylase
VLKDGGVLKIKKNKRALPAKMIFARRVKKMVRELEGNKYSGHVPRVFLGDARALDLPAESVGLIVTSPPYLNNIDYSKIYGLELSLLHMSKAEAQEVRMRAVRSFIGKDMKVQEMPPEVGDVGNRIPIIGTYFRDMEQAMEEMFRVLQPGASAHVVVSNSVIHQTHILVDEILGEIAERLGFSDVEIVVGAERIADVRPQRIKTRESIIVLKK